jgi:hypothetical protein
MGISSLDSKIFRPPYGKIKSIQAKQHQGYKIIMWDVLSADFDQTIKRKMLENVVSNINQGV